MDGREKEREEGKEVPEWTIFGDPGQAEPSPISHSKTRVRGPSLMLPFHDKGGMSGTRTTNSGNFPAPIPVEP